MTPILRPFPQALLFWLLFAIPTLLLGHAALDTDGAMRLVEVRDLLHGQSSFDLVQHRMNAPFGVPMHWSRLVDAPIALLILLGGEPFALSAWPLLVFLAVLWGLARLAFHAGGRAAMPVTLVLALLCVFLLPNFAPGAIDHHNVQMALTLWTLVFLLERRAIAAAIAITLALGVGMEVLPYAVLALLSACLWLRDDLTKLRPFGVTIAALALALLFGVAASRYRADPVCDTYSLFHAVLLAAGGIGIACVSLLPRHRFAAAGVLACGLLMLAALLNRDCFAGPYGGMSEQLRLVFLSRINEAHSAASFLRFAPGEWVGGFFYACILFAGGCLAPRSAAKPLLLVFALAALLVAAWQIRAVPFAILLALPVFAAALTRLLAVNIVGFALALLLGNQAAFAVAGVVYEGRARHDARIAAFGRQVACAAPENVALLTAQPPGLVAAFVDQGPAILAYTKDSVIAGPYHRDAAGILDTYRIFTAPPEQARILLKTRGVAYVMTCRAAPDWDFYRRSGPQGIVAAAPDWLAPLGRRADVTLYRVR